MRTLHRILAIFLVTFGLYIGTTGVAMQVMDLQAILSDAPATHPTMQAIRNGIYGPPNYAVLSEPDFSAAALPPEFDFDTALATVTGPARSALAGGPMSFVEFRVVDGATIARVGSGRQVFNFDASTGASLGPPTTTAPLRQSVHTAGLRNDIKNLHRFTGKFANIIMVLFGVSLLVMIFSGAVMYVRLLAARQRMGKASPFWSAGGLWRTLHRSIAAVAAIFLTVVALSGTVAATNALGVATNLVLNDGKRPGMNGDFSSPLSDAELPAMLHVTLANYRGAEPDAGIRVIRLRYFAGMPQGVVVTGEREADQLVFNTRNGRRASMSEPGYPSTGGTFGWEVDEVAKRIHRGDFFGLPGRVMDLLAGLSLLYLCVSGAVMYFDMWKKRRQKGRGAFFWSDKQPSAKAAAKAPVSEPVKVDSTVSSTPIGSGEVP